jgi:hypothetical protein
MYKKENEKDGIEMKVCALFFLFFIFGGKTFIRVTFREKISSYFCTPHSTRSLRIHQFLLLLKPERFSAKKRGGTQKRCFRQRRRRNKRGGPKPKK